MNSVLTSPMFGITLCIITFALGVFLNKKLKTPLANPLLIAIAFTIIILKVFNIPLEYFNIGGDFVSMFLGPATAALALSIYRQLDVLKKNFLPVVLGCLAGAVTSMGSIFLMCRLFRLDEKLTVSMLPKSVTTPIAMEISRQAGGVVPVTVAAVVVTGILGAVISPLLVKLFRVKNPVAAGVGIGSCSHAIGTSKAIELGEVQGAMSGISLSISGIITVILSLFLQ
mgnify:CR=1 FL=1